MENRLRFRRYGLRLRVGLALGLMSLAAGAYLAICGYTALRITRPGRRPFARDPGELALTFDPVGFCEWGAKPDVPEFRK